jgi:putative membrane protein
MLKKLSAFPILTFIALVAPLQAIAQQPQQPAAPPPGYFWPGPWHMWSDGYSSPFWWMFPLMMLCMLLIGAAIFFLARRAIDHGLHWGPSHVMDRQWNDATYSAMQILNERFARAEIPKDEYLEKKAIILSGARH